MAFVNVVNVNSTGLDRMVKMVIMIMILVNRAAAVVITFFVCWAPFHAQRLLFLYARNEDYYNDVNTWLFSVAGWLYYVSW